MGFVFQNPDNQIVMPLVLDDILVHFDDSRARAALVALATGHDAHRAARAAASSEQLNFGGTLRTYLLHIPDAPPPRGGFPVVLAFHGGGGDGARMRSLSRFDALADSRGVIVVYPDGVGKHWNDGRSTAQCAQLTREAEQRGEVAAEVGGHEQCGGHDGAPGGTGEGRRASVIARIRARTCSFSFQSSGTPRPKSSTSIEWSEYTVIFILSP